MTTPMIVFDFDGVISNSIHDSYLTALNSYITFNPAHQLPLKAPLNPPESVFSFEKTEPDLFKQFEHLLPFGNRAEDYYVFLKAMDRQIGLTIDSQNAFNTFKSSLDQQQMHRFHLAFYGLRVNRQNADPVAWSKLLPAFDGIIDTIKALSQRADLAIATAKDLRSVNLQLAYYGLTDYFNPQLILDKETSHSKRDHLHILSKRTQTPLSSMHFIDDKFLHLLSMDDLPVNKYLAAWGFNSSREHKQTITRQYTLLQLNDLANIAR